MVFIIAPSVGVLVSTIVLDVFNHLMAIKNAFNGTNAEGVITLATRKQREKIPKRATMINTLLFIPWIAYTAIIGSDSEMDLETRVLLVAFPNVLVNALRNPLIAAFAFQVNSQIKLESVEDRRKREIEMALKNRADRQKTKNNIVAEHDNFESEQAQCNLVTVNELHKNQPCNM